MYIDRIETWRIAGSVMSFSVNFCINMNVYIDVHIYIT